MVRTTCPIAAGSPDLERRLHAVRSLRNHAACGRLLPCRRLFYALAGDLGGGLLHRLLTEGCRAFHSGGAANARLLAGVFVALRASIAMHEAASVLADIDPTGELTRADRALEELADAVLLLDDRDYANAVRDADHEEQGWWGLRAALDRRVPESVTCGALDRLKERTGAEPDATEVLEAWVRSWDDAWT